LIRASGHNTPAQSLKNKGMVLIAEPTDANESTFNTRGVNMPLLRWAVIFLVVAIIAAILGFGGIAGAATDIARFLFFLFVAIFVIMLLMRLFIGKRL
jgi:uncharacterized membrane protein YtjA (UPF0391 family)